MRDREKVMDDAAINENWKGCFSQFAPGLLLFARQWVRSRADAEDIVQEAFVKFWRRNHSIDNRALLYTATDDDGTGPWLYLTDVRDRVTSRLSSGVEHYTSIAASVDVPGGSRRLAATVSNPIVQLWTVPLTR